MTENIEAESVKADEKVADESVPTSERKVNANRENAKQSTGPKTPQGKAYSRGNALKHGLTAKRVLFNAGTDCAQNIQTVMLLPCCCWTRSWSSVGVKGKD